MSADDGACKLYVLNFGGHELPYLTARRFVTADRAQAGPGLLGHGLGRVEVRRREDAAAAPVRRRGGWDDVSVARHTQGERFAGDELVAALDRAFGVKQSEDIAVTAPFQYDKATTPPVAAAPLAKSGLKLKNGGDLDANAERTQNWRPC